MPQRKGARVDITGNTYNNWYVNGSGGYTPSGTILWDCTCLKCGTRHNVSTYSLKSGKSRMCMSCSAKSRPESQIKATQAWITNGLSQTKLYQCLANMHRRCEDPRNNSYCRYGARGIKVCDEWSMDNVQVFYDWSIANGYKEGLQIDRIDVNGNYEPSNCRWVSAKVNSRNRRTNHMVTVFGETISLAEAVEKYSTFDYQIVMNRIYRYGYSIEDALTKQKRHNARKK